MKSRNLIHYIVTAFIGGAALAVSGGCVKEMDGYVTDGDIICFTARIDAETTKASPSTKLSGEAGIIGYVYNQWPAANGVFGLQPWTKLSKVTYIFDGDQLSSESNAVRWSEAKAEGENLKVFAYSPASDANMTVSYGTEGNYTVPSVTYTVPEDISRQTDIVTAVSEVSTGFKKNIPLKFDHILTGIKFKAGFGCKVNSITISDVVSSGTYTIGSGWHSLSGTQTYTVTFPEGNQVEAGEMITTDNAEDVMFMIPQRFAENSSAAVTLNYDNGKTLITSLKGLKWEEGRMITYTLYEKQSSETGNIYFDLAAGNVSITNSTYSGSIYVAGVVKTVSGEHSASNRYYVYQSSTSTEERFAKFGKNETGYATIEDFEANRNCRVPVYDPVKYNNVLWSDFITNNTSVEDVIEIWDDGSLIRDDKSPAPDERHIGTAVVREVGRTHTKNYISVTGSGASYNLTIDNIYSSVQQPVGGSDAFRKRNIGGIAYRPSGNTELRVNFVGDNRMGCLHIDDTPTDKIILEGTGSLTVADTDFLTVSSATAHINDFGDSKGYISNFWNSAIGNNTDDSVGEKVYNLYIKGGVVFAGATKAEDCTAIGGGGNGFGQVYINGGVVTAVATTAGTAIGGGMGHTSNGGPGEVHITGGNVYAYNFANKWNIASSAIGGGGSMGQIGSEGTVNISGGYVYAYSALGTGIGGGSSSTKKGGNATINISGGYIVAKSNNIVANGIGGGTGGTDSGVNGGTATVTISGSPIIRTGSIGGGKTNNSTGHIGSANINIHGGDIQAQFVMAAGAGVPPTFNMSGGLIRNSNTDDTEYLHVQRNGGAVYLEDGKFTMSAGEIRQCSADKGGAIYVKGTASTTFKMTGGKITECAAKTDGGGVYLEGGMVTFSGGEISHNLANKGNGGGFCIVGGNFSMPEGGSASIIENAAFSDRNFGGKGGGLYVTSTGDDVKVDVISGSIISNSSDRVGGGISVDMTGNETAKASVTVGKTDGGDENPLISDNHTIVLGGGLYAKGVKAGIVINSGKIAENTISGYVSNPDVANEGGMVTLNGGDVTHVTVTYNNNGAYYGTEVEFAEQKIVTSTNSTMIVPVRFEKLGYDHVGWNTRPDGKGVTYTEGQVMNLSLNLTLYAQWTISRN